MSEQQTQQLNPQDAQNKAVVDGAVSSLMDVANLLRQMLNSVTLQNATIAAQNAEIEKLKAALADSAATLAKAEERLAALAPKAVETATVVAD